MGLSKDDHELAQELRVGGASNVYDAISEPTTSLMVNWIAESDFVLVPASHIKYVDEVHVVVWHNVAANMDVIVESY